MSESSLPVRANLEWLKERSKDRLAELRAHDPSATLSAAQLAVARVYGFPSWRRLKARVEQVGEKLPRLATGAAAVAPDDPDLARVFAAIAAGEMPVITELLGRRPELARARGSGGQTPLHAAAQCDDNRSAVSGGPAFA